MTLSESEIKELVARTESCLNDLHANHVLPDLQEVIVWLDKIIANVPPNAYYYQCRSLVKLALCEGSVGVISSFAIEALDDICKAIDLDPDQALYYQNRGEVRLLLLKYRTNEADRTNEMALAMRDFETALSKDPTVSAVWLYLIMLNLLFDNWDEAISVYGQSKIYVTKNEDQLIRAWLGCLAITITGEKLTKEDSEPLQKSYTVFNCVFVENIMVHLGKYLRGTLPDVIQAQVDELNESFLKHLEDAIVQARIYSNWGQYEKALVVLEEALAKNPFDIKAWNNKGGVLSRLERYEDALTAYRKTTELAPDFLMPLYNTVSLLMCKLHRYNEALIVINKLIQFDPKNVDILNDKRICLANLSRFDEALVEINKLIELDPKNAKFWVDKSSYLWYLSRFTESLSAVQEALVLEPNNVQAWHNKALDLENQGRNIEALDAYNVILEITPENGVFWRQKALILENLQLYDEALYAYDKAIKFWNSEKTGPFHNKAELLRKMGRFEESLTFYNFALTCNCDDATVWNNKGAALECLGRFDEALKAYSKSVELDPTDVGVLCNKGVILIQVKKYDTASNIFDEVIAKIEPERNEILARAWYQKSRACSAMGDRAASIHYLSKALTLKPQWRYTAISDNLLKDLL